MSEYEWLMCEFPPNMFGYLYSEKFDIYHDALLAVRGHESPLESVFACNLIREVVGNPFRPVLLKPETTRVTETLDTNFFGTVQIGEPRWFTTSVLALAADIIKSGYYGDVDVLADLLEEAGCDNEEILRHLRGEVRCAECGGDEIAIRDGPIFCTVCCNSCWLPKPVPCQPGCWVLRLLTEDK